MQAIPLQRPAAVVAPSHISDSSGSAMARATVNLFRRWGVGDAEACTLLGGMSASTYARWKRGDIGRLGTDLKTRLSLLMGVHKALRILFTDKDRVYHWVMQPNTALEGARPLDVMLRGQIMDLYRIRNFLDAARGW